MVLLTLFRRRRGSLGFNMKKFLFDLYCFVQKVILTLERCCNLCKHCKHVGGVVLPPQKGRIGEKWEEPPHYLVEGEFFSSYLLCFGVKSCII